VLAGFLVLFPLHLFPPSLPLPFLATFPRFIFVFFFFFFFFLVGWLVMGYNVMKCMRHGNESPCISLQRGIIPFSPSHTLSLSAAPYVQTAGTLRIGFLISIFLFFSVFRVWITLSDHESCIVCMCVRMRQRARWFGLCLRNSQYLSSGPTLRGVTEGLYLEYFVWYIRAFILRRR
jgi:hypothetical protein